MSEVFSEGISPDQASGEVTQSEMIEINEIEEIDEVLSLTADLQRLQAEHPAGPPARCAVDR